MELIDNIIKINNENTVGNIVVWLGDHKVQPVANGGILRRLA